MIIKGRALEHRSTFRIDKKFHAIAFDHRVTRFSFIQNHFVLQAGATALRDLNAEPSLLRCRLCLQERTKMLRRLFRDVDHRQKSYRDAWASQPMRPQEGYAFAVFLRKVCVEF